METPPIPSSNPHDLDCMRSRIRELEEVARGFSEVPNSEPKELLEECVLQLESKVKQIVAECSDVSFLGVEDLDAYLEHLKEELHATESDIAKVSKEIEVLAGKQLTDAIQFESNLEGLKCSFEHVQSQAVEKGNDKAAECISLPCGDDGYEIRKLESQIVKSDTTLKSLQNLVNLFSRLDAIEQVGDLLSSVKVIEVSGPSIRLALRTCVPKLDLVYLDMNNGAAGTSEVHHELLIEVNVETMELKDAKIFPTDVYIGDIIDATESFRQTSSQLTVPKKRSPMEWFVGNVQDRIAQCTLRRLIVKGLNKSSRFSLQYMDREECISVRFASGVDASIRVSQGWPVSRSPLKLISLKSPSHSSNLLQMVEEAVSSLDVQTQCDMSRFLDAIENALDQQPI